jgi:bifunctional non-homologous end joining protein LigD
MRPLTEYHRKRDFHVTSEPAGRKARPSKNSHLIFVVQEHHASHLHYDFRLEWGGVLHSWAVPKGPSMNPKDKRLAVQVEDHPLEYASFEGEIPENQYGAGQVYRWDSGTWIPSGDVDEGLKSGKLEFELRGKKLRGTFLLLRLASKNGSRSRKPNWLLMKRAERAAAESGFIEPQLAQLATEPPSGDQWLHEPKFDGYRIQAHLGRGVHLISRRGSDWTARYELVARDLAKLKLKGAVLDGEVVWQEGTGNSFQKLQNSMSAKSTDPLVYWVFDILTLRGRDLRSLPLRERKRELETIFKKQNLKHIRLTPALEVAGTKMLEASCGMKYEGIVSKRVDAPYASGRTSSWVKAKCGMRQEFVIAGYTEGKGLRAGHFGSLLLGVYEGPRLRYVGRVGTGFDVETLRQLKKRLVKLKRKDSPFDLGEPRMKDVHWIKPELVAEISFVGWTNQRILRSPVFQGLREDKPARQVVVEKPRDIQSTDVTHPERVVFKREGITKGDVAKYYAQVAPLMLPLIQDRPLSLIRCPQGTGAKCFFARHFTNLPEGLIAVREEGEKDLFALDSSDGILSLVQLGTIEMHAWNCHRQDLEAPDQIVMDFDPSPRTDFEFLKELALELREILATLGIESFVKTTGGSGLHVQFPFEPRYSWDQVKDFAKTLVTELASRHPKKVTGRLPKADRTGKVFIDYLRNDKWATAVAPYSLRAKKTSAVAMPLAWDELEAVKSSDEFSLWEAAEALRGRREDPWKGYSDLQQTLGILDELKAANS